MDCQTLYYQLYYTMTVVQPTGKQIAPRLVELLMKESHGCSCSTIQEMKKRCETMLSPDIRNRMIESKHTPQDIIRADCVMIPLTYEYAPKIYENLTFWNKIKVTLMG